MPASVSLTVDRDVPTRLRDDTTLYADVYRPAGPGPYPTLFERTPYDKAVGGPSAFTLRATTAGYAVVIQDVRGRFASEGEFTCFVNERPDGEDALEWLAAQPWCDGNIGMFGGSYVGLTQWQAAMSGHPALKAIAPSVTAADYHAGWVYQGGAFELGFNLSWTLGPLALNTIMRREGKGTDFQASLDGVDGLVEGFQRLPLAEHPLLATYAPYYDEWLAHPTYDDYWAGLDVSAAHDRLAVAALNIGGWYDIFLKGTIDNFAGLRARAATPELRQRQRLLLGPWNHGGRARGNPIGAVDFGQRSTGAIADVDGVQLRWFDRWLKGLDNGVDGEPAARLFVMGANVWRDEQEWPLARTDWQRWHLRGDGRANTLNGDGALDREAPGAEPPDTYVYNPRNPVPTMGGGLCCNAVFTQGGAYDQRSVEAREDVLVYSTPPLTAPLEVTGPVQLVLYAGTSAPDTDFTAKLVDVAPCGYARNLTDGILRARYRNSMSEGELVTPGEVVRYEIDLWSTSNVFLPGHRLRVEVSSSNFPRFDRNPNTGELPGRSAEMVSALQTIHHSAEYPSHLVLPVIPAS
ncbi:MAG TPA: CocE/NonD family hydrolase [Thermomicrobiales bacterium]|nr:CocE/NonD family hydrolase [Thermomicrobiales bacterium]